MSDSVEIVAACGGELITYIPYGGTAKTFKAIVERRPSRIDAAGGVQYAVHSLEVWIPMDATNGLLEIHERKDRIRFKRSLSDADVTEFVVGKILTHDSGLGASDGGMFHLEVQA